jgi:phosphohistidine phosphatase SixA
VASVYREPLRRAGSRCGLGALFQEHGVTLEAVLSSEFCRALETAEPDGFGGFTVLG